MKEKKNKVEIISKEDIEKVVKDLKEAKEVYKEKEEEEDNLNLDKVRELVESLEGCTPQTVVGFISTAYLLLPAGAIIAAMNIGKQAFKAKAIIQLMDIMKEKDEEE